MPAGIRNARNTGSPVSGSRKSGKVPFSVMAKRFFSDPVLSKLFWVSVCVIVLVPLLISVISAGAGSSEADFLIAETGCDPDTEIIEARSLPVTNMFKTEKAAETASAETAKPTESQSETATETEPEESSDVSPDTFYVTLYFWDREPFSFLSSPATLWEMLVNAGYTILDSDVFSIDLDTYIDKETSVQVDTVTYDSITEASYTPFEVETYDSQSVPRGTTQTVTYGSEGVTNTVYTVQYKNGVEVSREKQYEYIESYPQNQIDYHGIGGTFTAADGTTYSYSYILNCRATYYNLPGNTAIGLPVGNNVIAVDPSVIPLGSSVYVANDSFDFGVRIAADTGGAIIGNIIDIWMDYSTPGYEQFAAIGVTNMSVYILD